MSFQRFCKETDSGARKIECDGNTYFIQDCYVNRVISLRERNGYHDSDFYAKVWDDESQTVKEIEYATTSFWCYPLYNATIDAPEEIKKLAEAYELKMFRKSCAKMLLCDRRYWIQDRKEIGLKSYLPLKRLAKAVSKERYTSALKLLRTKKFRSDFRKSLFNQIITWASQKKPQYHSPLSDKQWSYLY